MNAKINKAYFNISSIIKKWVNSSIFPYLSAAITLICYYMGWDLFLMYYLGLSALVIFAFSDDVTPAVCVFLFISIMISKQNSPSPTVDGSDLFARPSTIAQIAVLATAIGISLIFCFIKNIKRGRAKLTPAFFGIAALSLVFIVNGLFSHGYEAENATFGLVMAFFWLGIFALVSFGISSGEGSFKRSCTYFAAFGLTLMSELAVAYITTDGIFEGGHFHRSSLMFGWGVYNTMGTYLVICIPPVIYLAAKHPRGYFYYILGIALLICSYFSGSRQAMVSSTAIFPVCVLIMLIRGRNRKINLLITALCAAVGGFLMWLYRDDVYKFLQVLLENIIVDGEPNGSGRWDLWKAAVENFRSSPLFGTGFYVELEQDYGATGLDFIPRMYHDTLMELAAACGICGLFAYLIHRAQTVISFFKNPSFERAFMALTVIALLIASLFDNHLFYIYPNLVYSSVIAMFFNSEKEA